MKSFYCSGSNLTSLDFSKNVNLQSFSCINNTYEITVKDNKFDLSTLPGNFDVSKASNWIGGTVAGNILTVDEKTESVKYTYDLGNEESVSFTLNVVRKVNVVDGDVNMDGVLSILDATAIQQYLAGISGIVFDETVADFNKDSSISILDATDIQKKLAGIK